jgi:hypothetical protein
MPLFGPPLLPRHPGSAPLHVRCACLWCGAPDSECGIHLLECPRAPDGVADRVAQFLRRIYNEAEKCTIGGPWRRTPHNKAMAYTCTLEWPNMTASKLQAALRTIGGLPTSLDRGTWGAQPHPQN